MPCTIHLPIIVLLVGGRVGGGGCKTYLDTMFKKKDRGRGVAKQRYNQIRYVIAK